MTTKTTSASIGEATSFPIPFGGETASGIGAAVVAAVMGIIWLRRRFSRDGTELIKDRAEGELTQKLMQRADAEALNAKEARAEAKAAWAEYNKLVADVGQLRAENVYLKREVERLLGELTKAQTKLDEIRGDLWKLRKTPSADSDNVPLR